MPKIDGIQATIKIKKHLNSIQHQNHPKIIGVTGHVHKKYRDEGHRAGMDEVVSKPLYIDDLQIILKKYNLIE
jgi:CheY-like chemotaxis protein